VVGDLLVSRGFFETLSNSLTNPDYESLNGEDRVSQSVRVLNPLSNELSAMRQSILSSLMEASRHNANRKKQDQKLFEFGAIYRKVENTYQENKQLALLLTGNRNAESWLEPPVKSDFFYFKAIVTLVLQRLGIDNWEESPLENGIFSEGLVLKSGKESLVEFGVLRKEILKRFDLKAEVLYAEFDWNILVQRAATSKMVFQEVPRYPGVRRDFALLLDQKVTFKQIYDLAFKTERKILNKVNLFDVYTGKNLPEDKKSYAVSFMLQDRKKTLTDAQIEKVMKKLEKQFVTELGAELR
jgi:phenylalanyl-tRNA synthetase beta chain